MGLSLTGNAREKADVLGTDGEREIAAKSSLGQLARVGTVLDRRSGVDSEIRVARVAPVLRVDALLGSPNERWRYIARFVDSRACVVHRAAWSRASSRRCTAHLDGRIPSRALQVPGVNTPLPPAARVRRRR